MLYCIEPFKDNRINESCGNSGRSIFDPLIDNCKGYFFAVKCVSKRTAGKTLPYKAVVSASDDLVKEAKRKEAGEEPKPEPTPAEAVDAIIKRIERALTDLAPFKEAGYEATPEQLVKLAAIKARLA